ncbi:MAG: thioredoxin [Alistipes sp.]|nr:thioredoxin [Alistipes sp.]
MKAIELTAEAFQKQVFDYTKNSEWKYEGDLPAVIDFYATWCGPCKAMAPVMETLAEEYAGRVHIYKVDVDKEKRLAALFGVRSIPTFIFIPAAGNPQHANGAMGIEQMRGIIDSTLLGSR